MNSRILPSDFFDLGQDRLQPLLKLAPVLGSGDEGAHVQGEDGLVLEVLGHVAPDDPLGQPLGNGGFAHAGLADEHGVVFVFRLRMRITFRISSSRPMTGSIFLLPGPAHQIRAVLLQGLIGVLRAVGGDPLVAPDGLQGLQAVLFGDAVGPLTAPSQAPGPLR